MRHGLITAAVCAAFFSTTAYAAEIVAPNDQATVESNTAGNFNASATGQQVLFDVSSTQFSALPAGDVITGISFRPDTNLCGPCSTFSTTLHNVTIKVATTSIAATLGTDTTFADYLTTNVQTVFTGDLTISSGETLLGPNGPKAFDINFPFSSSYAYNPALGNLVIDIVIASTDGLPSSVDAVATNSSENFGAEYFAVVSGATTGLANSNLDIIEFTTGAPVTSAVPEPASWALMLFGVGALGAAMRTRPKPAARYA